MLSPLADAEAWCARLAKHISSSMTIAMQLEAAGDGSDVSDFLKAETERLKKFLTDVKNLCKEDCKDVEAF